MTTTVAGRTLALPAPWWERLARLGARLVCRHPELLTAVLSAALLFGDVRGPDLPAQNYRVWLLRHHGLVVFDSHWYAGHTLPGYSLLFPPLAAVVGVRLLGALSCVVATALMARLLRGGRSGGHDLALLWFAAVSVVDLAVGRMPFALGVALGLAAVVGTKERRPALAAAAALACSTASPLAAAFLLLTAAAWLPDAGWRRVAPLGAAVAGIAAAAVFGEGGSFPFPAVTLLAVLATVVVGLLVTGRDQPSLRRGLVLYGLSSLVLFVVPNPLGGNAIRFAAVFVGPLAAYELLRRHRPRVLALLAVPLLLWQFAPLPAALATAGRASTHAGYYAGLTRYLDANGAATQRLEVPLTKGRWETDYLATRFSLARGWERQVDLAHNAVLYSPHLDAATYEQWLHDNAVRWVALPDAPLDGSEVGERALLTGPPLPFLRPVWHDAHWRLWAVSGARSLVRGPATLLRLGVQQIRLQVRRAGVHNVTVLVRWTRFWRVTAGAACIAPTADGWISVSALHPGPVSIDAHLGLRSLAGNGAAGSCSR